MRPRRSLAAVAAVGVLALAPPAARAGIDDESWYGYQIAVADLVGWGLFIGGVSSSKKDEVVFAGFSTLLLGGPIIHAVHGNYLRGGISFGARVGAPVLGGVVGVALDKSSKSWIPAGLFVGAFVGSLAASVVDIVLLAYDKDEDPSAPRMLSFGGHF
jgi:hypothetical protein